MKLEELKPAAEMKIWYDGSEIAKSGIIPAKEYFLCPVGTKFYTLEQVLPVVHEMARELLRTEVMHGEKMLELTQRLEAAENKIRDMALEHLASEGQWIEKTGALHEENDQLRKQIEQQTSNLRSVARLARTYGIDD